MVHIILKSLYFFLPAYIANMAPVLVRKIPILDKPVNEKFFGENKTWRGLLIAPLAGLLVFLIQKIYYNRMIHFSVIDYSDFSLLLGFLMGLGVIFGDLIKSYYKRKVGIKPGQRWIPWDQLDFVFGGLLLSFLIYIPFIEVVVVILIFSPVLHIIANRIGYLLKISKSKF